MNTIQRFVEGWERDYGKAARTIRMFDPTCTLSWSLAQQGHFARLFYHARATFSLFLWQVGSGAETKEEKQAVLANIADEFGIAPSGRLGPSHDELYYRFAEAVGVSKTAMIAQEMFSKRSNRPFIEEFNLSHQRWLTGKPADHVWAAFAAYEVLDNPDAENLHRMFRQLGVAKRGLAFFDVHRRVQHAEAAMPVLTKVWERDKDAVRAGFKFIAAQQLKLWQGINDEVFALHG